MLFPHEGQVEGRVPPASAMGCPQDTQCVKVEPTLERLPGKRLEGNSVDPTWSFEVQEGSHV